MSKKVNLVLVILWPIAASLISLAINAGTFTSMLLFLAVPGAYLSLFKKDFVLKAAIFSLITAIPIGIVADYIMELTGGWYLPNSIFGDFRLFNYVSAEQIIWLFFYVYFVIIYYEVFLEDHKAISNFHINMKYMFLIMASMLGIFLFFYTFSPKTLEINYFYLKFGIVIVLLPIIIVLAKFPQLSGKFFKASTYFFFLSITYEVTALKLNQWSFPAENQFVGIIELFGQRFPFEELFFWIILGSLATLSYYEFYDDDKK